MGLIKSIFGSAFSQLNDMWTDYIYCDSLDNDTLVRKGHKKSAPGAGGSSDDNVITQGSKIAVNAGQTLIIVENGNIIDYTAEQGGYEFNSDAEPSAFQGDLDEGVRVTFEQMKKRFAYGGRSGNDQRAYFINNKEILANKFGFGNVPYRDSEFDLTITLQGYGTFSYKITNPLLFYTNISGNVSDVYEKSTIASQIKAELQNALLPAFADLGKSGVRYDELPSYMDDLAQILREKTEDTWKNTRGIEIQSIALSNIIPDENSVDKIRDLQESRIYSTNKSMLGARVGAAQANAMESAAENPNGAANAFFGMNMAGNAGGVNVNELMKDSESSSPTVNNSGEWTCQCGYVNTMNFCPNCGNKKPSAARCSSCGYELPADMQAAKFCPNCGNSL